MKKAGGAIATASGKYKRRVLATVPVNAVPVPPPAGAAVSRGYDMTMVTDADSGVPAANVGNTSSAGPITLSANAYYASLGKSAASAAGAATNNVYADPNGNVFRHDGSAWQQRAATGWATSPAAPTWGAQEMQSRNRAAQTAAQAGSYGMSNATRFAGNRGDGWTRRDAGSGGYSRTLGGDGGISAERAAYNDAVLNNEFDIAANGGWWGDSVTIGAIGWGGRYGAQ